MHRCRVSQKKTLFVTLGGERVELERGGNSSGGRRERGSSGANNGISLRFLVSPLDRNRSYLSMSHAIRVALHLDRTLLPLRFHGGENDLGTTSIHLPIFSKEFSNVFISVATLRKAGFLRARSTSYSSYMRIYIYIFFDNRASSMQNNFETIEESRVFFRRRFVSSYDVTRTRRGKASEKERKETRFFDHPAEGKTKFTIKPSSLFPQ